MLQHVLKVIIVQCCDAELYYFLGSYGVDLGGLSCWENVPLWALARTAHHGYNYNTRARQYAGIMERRFSFDPQVTFWLWDRRQAWRNVDGVHFLHHGYRQAIRYLIAFIVWVINHNLW